MMMTTTAPVGGRKERVMRGAAPQQCCAGLVIRVLPTHPTNQPNQALGGGGGTWSANPFIHSLRERRKRRRFSYGPDAGWCPPGPPPQKTKIMFTFLRSVTFAPPLSPTSLLLQPSRRSFSSSLLPFLGSTYFFLSSWSLIFPRGRKWVERILCVSVTTKSTKEDSPVVHNRGGGGAPLWSRTAVADNRGNFLS